MGRRGVRAVDPSPEQIAEMTAAIRNGWNRDERRKRDEREPYRVPVIAPRSLLLDRPIVRIH